MEQVNVSGGCFIALLQTSESMGQPLDSQDPEGAGRTRLKAACDAVASSLGAALALLTPDDPPLRFAVLVCGGGGVASAFEGTIPAEPWMEAPAGAEASMDEWLLPPLTALVATGGAPLSEGVATLYRVVLQELARHPLDRRCDVLYCGDGEPLDDRTRTRLNSLDALLFAHGGSRVSEWTADSDRVDLAAAVASPEQSSVRLLLAESRPYTDIDIHTASLAKIGNSENEWEDAFAIDRETGRIAVSDGAGSGIYSKVFARILTESARSAPSLLGEFSEFREWVDHCRKEWQDGINYPALSCFQQAKVDRFGAAATLLTLEFASAPDGGIVWIARAVGDSCLFWIRDNRLYASFPCVSWQDFGKFPDLLMSRVSPERAPLQAAGRVRVGDLFVLATDAVAQWLLKSDEETGVDWQSLCAIEPGVWPARFRELFDARQIENDDFTILFARIGQQPGCSEQTG